MRNQRKMRMVESLIYCYSCFRQPRVDEKWRSEKKKEKRYTASEIKPWNVINTRTRKRKKKTKITGRNG